MKRMLILLALSAGVAGCGGPASQSGVWGHDTLYRNLDHMSFSWGGHAAVSTREAQKSTEEGWWGTAVPAAPAR